MRVTFHGRGIPEGLRDNREAFAQWLLTAPAESLVDIQEVTIDEPEPARIHQSAPCDICGETVMETRLREIDEKRVCIPCAEKILNS